MKTKSLLRSSLPTLATFFLSVGVAAQPLSVPLHLGPSEIVGGGLVRNDGSAVVALESLDRRATRLLSISSAGKTTEITVPGISISRIEDLGRSDGAERFFVGGATGPSRGGTYVHRLLAVSEGEVQVLWDSADLAPLAPLEKGAELDFEASRDGRLWTALRRKAVNDLEVWFGRFPENRPFARVDLAVEAGPGAGAQASDDFPTLAILRSDPAAPVAAVLWHNLIYVLEPGPTAVRKVLAPGRANAVTLRWQPSAQRLWTQADGTWLGFDLDLSNLAPASGEPIAPAVQLDTAALGSRPLELFPLADGRVAVLTPEGVGQSLAFGSPGPQGLERGATRPAPTAEILRLSPDGGRALALPGGQRSKLLRLASLTG